MLALFDPSFLSLPLAQKKNPSPVQPPLSIPSLKMDEQLLHGHNSAVECVALRSNGQVASGSRKGSIIIHSTSSNKVVYRADNVFAYDVHELCYLLDGSGLVAMMMMMMRVPT